MENDPTRYGSDAFFARLKAKMSANALVVFRSAGNMYQTRRSRRDHVERWLASVRFFENASEYSVRTVIPTRIRSAVIDFCLGHIGACTLGRRVFEEFQITDDDRRSVLDTATYDDRRSRSRVQKCRIFWCTLYDRLRTLTAVSVLDAESDGYTEEDKYDARIEFMCQTTVDPCSGVSNGTDGDGGFLTFDELHTTLSTVGYMNTSVSCAEMSDTTEPATPTDRQPVYVFGSNCIWIESDAVYTLDSPTERSSVFDNGDDELTEFGQRLTTDSGVEFIADVATCRNAAAARNRPTVTSVSNNQYSLQLVFAMPDSSLYTANVFYLCGGNTCATDLRYARRWLSNACRCENRLSCWRVCVSISAITATAHDLPDGIPSFVQAVVRAVYEAKSGEEGSHFYLNAFSGLAIIDYNHDTTAVGGSVTADGDRTPAATTCYIHAWLRAHSNALYWWPVVARHTTGLLENTPQLIVVRRPLLSETIAADHGPNIFLKYKTFEDVIVKYVLLTSFLLRRGYANTRRGIAYKAADCFWLYSDGDTQTPADDTPAWLRTVNAYGDIPLFDRRRDAADLFDHVFSAPSRLYVHRSVLVDIGFNATAVQEAKTARTFLHTDAATNAPACTVFCSSPLVVIDEKTGTPVECSQREGTDDPVVFELAADERSFRTPSKDVPPFVETVTTPLGDFWPGVDAVKTTFRDPVLKNVEFVYFTARDRSDALGRLTRDGLTRMGESIANDPDFEPMSMPVLFALQQMCAARETYVGD